MINKKTFFLLAAFCVSLGMKAQYANIDSATAAKTLTQLSLLSKGSEFSTAAQFIAYRGPDLSRAWKETADYSKPGENILVDAICQKINNTINQDPGQSIVGFRKESDEENTWYILKLKYKKDGNEKTADFTFVKINGRFALGNINE